MGKSVRTNPGSNVQDPLQPKDFFGQFDSIPHTFGNVNVKETTRELPSFNPKEFGNLNNPTPYDDMTALGSVDASKQGYFEQAKNSMIQLGANFVSGFGQGLANLVDVSAWGNDNYQSSLFGLSTKDMQEWSTGIAERAKILRENPGKFEPGSFGWWMEQVGSAGTGLGMGAFALAETAAIEYLTGGTGTGAAINRLGNLFKNIKNVRGAEGMLEAARAAKDLRSAATLYGVLNRTNESRMEAMQSYNEIYDEMAKQKNPDGTTKYTEDELRNYAAQGSDRTFWGNMALLPLDILAFRTMVFNPISGSATGLLERGLSKIGNKALRKTIQYGTGATFEGFEEGGQFVMSDEGKHYARVLGGQDDGSSFIQRLGADVSQDEFWNNFAGGVIGSPIIGGAMNLANKVMTGNRTAKLNSIHADYVKNIAGMDNAIASKIKQYQENGETDKADILRRQFRANKALSALHLDAMTDKDTAFQSHLNFLEETLSEVNQGKLDSLQDLGFANPTQEQIDYIKTSFQNSINDANQMKAIYDNVKDKYNRNFVPEIAQDHFQLAKLGEAETKVNQDIVAMQGKLNQFGELSTYGKQIYDSEYQLRALQQELSRLQQQFKSTKDIQEQSNIESVIEDVKERLTKVKDSLDEISKEDNYTASQKKKDNDILNSALKDDSYAQAVYDKVHIANAMMLQRKNIALWNNKEYTAKKTAENIAKARTPQQVNNIAQGNTSTEVQQAAQEKQNEIAATEAAAVVKQENETNTNSDQIGNGNLFEEDSNFINAIKSETVGKSTSAEEGLVNDTEEVYLLAPSEFDFENSPQESKDKVINGVKGLVDRLQGEPNFENLVRHVAKVQGLDTADSIFNALKWGWEAAGFTSVDYNFVYNKVFGNPLDDLLAGTKGLTIRNTKQLEEATGEVTEGIAAESGQPEFDNNSQPVYTYKGIVTNESSPKFAFVTRLSELNNTVTDDGSIVVSHEYTEDELNHGDYVDSLQLLDPDKFNEGTEMSAEVPVNFKDVKIPIYNADGTKGKSITFGQYVAENELTPFDQEYIDKVPIIIYSKNWKVGDKGVAFVHDIGWYHPLRFHQEYQDSMEDAINKTRAIREAVINSNSVPIIITGKRQTTFSGLKTKPNETVTLREANPDTQLTVALTTDSLSTSKSNRIFPNDETVLVNNSPFGIGQVFDVRRYGRKGDKKSFIALPVIKPKLDELSRSTVLQTINIYANRSNQNPEIRSKHDPIVKQIQTTMGLDILSPQGIEKYLQHFITTFNTEKASTNEHVEQQAKAKLASGTPYIAFIAGGNIVIGKAGEAAYVDRTGNKKFSFFINPNTVSPSTLAINNLAKPGMIGWFEQNVNLDALNRNKPVVTIDKDLNATVSANTYNDFLLDRLKTNIKSYNIGTATSPNYVTNIQPIITYDLKSTIRPTEVPADQVGDGNSAQQGDGRTVLETTEGKLGTNETVLSELEKQILEQAKRDLGADFGISRNDIDLFNPAELTEEQRLVITQSINRIAGLTPDQQFDIVDFMYNQITAMVNLDNKQMTKSEVDKQVTQAFNDVIIPLKESYQGKVKELQSTLDQHPALKTTSVPDVIKDYQYRINKIEAIEASFNTLKEEAYNKVAKYTGITENKVINEKANDDQRNEENPDTNVDDEPMKGERDFWTDILQENPESRLSYSMRRFFGQVKKYDKNGNPVKGFLGLPTYTGSDVVIRTLMVTLADTPSSFEAMIRRLEDRKEGIPWMQEVINKLNGATNQQKQQFVTVMSNTSLRMKFTMISFNRKTNSWTTKVWDTHMNGVADAIRREWGSNFRDSNLTIQDEEGNLKLNDIKAKSLISTFEGWTGKLLPEVTSGMDAYRPEVDKVKKDKPVIISAAGILLDELKANLKSNSDRMKFSMKGFDYQISSLGNGKYQISFLQQNVATKEDVNKWLNEFGVNLSDKTLDELMVRGLFHNYKQRKPNELFDGSSNTNGLFGILYNSLKTLVDKPDVNFTEEGNSPLDNSVTSSLANLEAKYNTTNTPFGFRDNGKSFFALTAPKFITDRVRDLKSVDETVRSQLLSISFSNSSLWLHLLGDERFKDKFGVAHIGANAFKELGKKLYRDNAITKLADVDHELTKLGMFWDTTQGEVRYGKEDFSTYPGTNVSMRMGTMFSPTMSDKHMMTLITTAVLNLGNADLNNGAAISEEVSRIIYEQTVRPELRRMVKFYQNGGVTNISAYDKGAGMFLLMPAMNNIEYSPGLRLIDAIKHQPGHFTTEFVEGSEDLMNKINHTISEYVNSLVNEKLEIWKKNELLLTDEKGDITDLKFFDRKYRDKFRGNNSEIAKMAAMDYVINYMISNANSFMTIAGDPALCFKSKATDPIVMAKDTFTNVGKRLAAMIAPGTTLSNSEHEKYIQIMIADRQPLAETAFLKFVTKINDGNEITDKELEALKGTDKNAKQSVIDKYPISSGYFGVDISDGQEYTTWKEHLDILEKMGKTTDLLIDVTADEIAEARELFSSDVTRGQLTERQKQLIGKVLQPMKPVYTGQIYDPNQDVMRTMYIKCSSFPLIPQLTSGMEIDKLRQEMEKLENNRKMNVRASYQSANKVGSISNPVYLWNNDGTAIPDISGLDWNAHSLVLDRKNFRIQQEVPFKSSKVGEDKITLGTQLMKLLFGDEIMTYDGFKYNGREYSGGDLHKKYNDLFIDLVKEKRSQLYSELALDENGSPLNTMDSMRKLQTLLKDEAVKRGYPLQDIAGLTLTKNWEFNLPLWASANSNRYESMLNAIITNRLIRMKFPGNSFIVGSEEGFITGRRPGLQKYIDPLDDNNETQTGMSQDIRMRNKATGFLGEVLRNNSSSYHSAETIANRVGAKINWDSKSGYLDAISSDTKQVLLARNFEFKDKDISKDVKDRLKQLVDKGVTFILGDMAGVDNQFMDYLDEIGGKYDVYHTKGNTKLDTHGDPSKSKIIWTSAWNGKNLQASYFDNGELKKAQVLVASKFKTPEGVLVNLFEKTNGEYKYITKSDNGFFLKEGMFSKELLSMITFRIPTSGHQSASQIEVAGFLPMESADLMIVPRNFTKQKGLDFDVDKENAYQLWNYMNEDGSFEVLQEKHRASILAKADRAFKEKSDSHIENLFAAMFGDMSQAEIEDYTSEEISADKKLAKLNSKINEKLLQNEIIKINHSVMGANIPQVQSKINKTLNTDYTEAQAQFIDGLISSNKSDAYWTPLSDEYQKQKMMAGASGKIGTGAYSLDVVFHSLAQQAAINGRPIQIIETIDEGESKIARPKVWRFGRITSSNILGSTTTIDGSRTISEVMSERQNVAVDNEKLQIMGRVNLNDITMDVDKVMNMVGLDKGSDGNSISFLFLSQPIIREFVERMKNANSNVAEFEPDKEGRIVEELLKKYEGDQQIVEDDEYWNVMSNLMTNQSFITALQSTKPNGSLQGAVLRRFMEMRRYGIAIRGIQTTINTDSKGLGKSFFDVIEKRNALNKLGIDTNMIVGASGLIGTYISKDDLTKEDAHDLTTSGYVDIGKFLVKPDTLSGGFNIMGVSVAYNMWNKFFPYDTPITNKAFEEVLSIIGSENMGENRIIELKQEVFRGMKKYFASSRFNGIIKPEDDINEERRRLFIDSDNNTSLAKYLKTIKSMVGNPVVDTFIKTNKLINRFEYEIQKNGQPSLIKYNNASGEEFDEQYLYESLATLMEVRGAQGSVQLPGVGNKSYTLDTLAQDLIAYCYLGNAIQEAIQFTKYAPVSYLNQVGFSEKMRATNTWLKDNPNILGIKIGNKDTERHLVSEFTMQYVQHNPEKVKYKLDSKNFSQRTIKGEGDTFVLKTEEKPTFISVYDSSVPKGEKKFRLYWFDGTKYTRVPVLGTFGMDEYQVRNQIGKSIVNGRVRIKAEPETIIKQEVKSEISAFNYNLESEDGAIILKAIADDPGSSYAPLAKHLLPYIGNVTVKITDQLKLRGDKIVDSFNGFYDANSGIIYVHPNIINDPHALADTIVHEFVHKLTYDAVEPHINVKIGESYRDVVVVNANAPVYVSNLVRLYNNLRENQDDRKIREIAAKVGLEGLTYSEKSQYYGFINIHEFMAMALTHRGFQEYLSKIEYKQTGMSFLDRFKQIISQVFQAIGIKFDEKYTAAHAISTIFDVIDQANPKKEENPYQAMYDDAINYDDMPPDDLLTDFFDGEPVGELSPADVHASVRKYIDQLNPEQKFC